jgi:hypothetical protein
MFFDRDIVPVEYRILRSDACQRAGTTGSGFNAGFYFNVLPNSPREFRVGMQDRCLFASPTLVKSV